MSNANSTSDAPKRHVFASVGGSEKVVPNVGCQITITPPEWGVFIHVAADSTQPYTDAKLRLTMYPLSVETPDQKADAEPLGTSEAYLSDATATSEAGNQCVVSLPLPPNVDPEKARYTVDLIRGDEVELTLFDLRQHVPFVDVIETQVAGMLAPVSVKAPTPAEDLSPVEATEQYNVADRLIDTRHDDVYDNEKRVAPAHIRSRANQPSETSVVDVETRNADEDDEDMSAAQPLAFSALPAVAAPENATSISSSWVYVFKRYSDGQVDVLEYRVNENKGYIRTYGRSYDELPDAGAPVLWLNLGSHRHEEEEDDSTTATQVEVDHYLWVSDVRLGEDKLDRLMRQVEGAVLTSEQTRDGTGGTVCPTPIRFQRDTWTGSREGAAIRPVAETWHHGQWNEVGTAWESTYVDYWQVADARAKTYKEALRRFKTWEERTAPIRELNAHVRAILEQRPDLHDSVTFNVPRERVPGWKEAKHEGDLTPLRETRTNADGTTSTVLEPDVQNPTPGTLTEKDLPRFVFTQRGPAGQVTGNDFYETTNWFDARQWEWDYWTLRNRLQDEVDRAASALVRCLRHPGYRLQRRILTEIPEELTGEARTEREDLAAASRHRYNTHIDDLIYARPGRAYLSDELTRSHIARELKTMRDEVTTEEEAALEQAFAVPDGDEELTYFDKIFKIARKGYGFADKFIKQIDSDYVLATQLATISHKVLGKNSYQTGFFVGVMTLDSIGETYGIPDLEDMRLGRSNLVRVQRTQFSRGPVTYKVPQISLEASARRVLRDRRSQDGLRRTRTITRLSAANAFLQSVGFIEAVGDGEFTSDDVKAFASMTVAASSYVESAGHFNNIIDETRYLKSGLQVVGIGLSLWSAGESFDKGHYGVLMSDTLNVASQTFGMASRVNALATFLGVTTRAATLISITTGVGSLAVLGGVMVMQRWFAKSDDEIWQFIEDRNLWSDNWGRNRYTSEKELAHELLAYEALDMEEAKEQEVKSLHGTVRDQIDDIIQTIHGFDMDVGETRKSWMDDALYVPTFQVRNCVALPRDGEFRFTFATGSGEETRIRIPYQGRSSRDGYEYIDDDITSPDPIRSYWMRYQVVQEQRHEDDDGNLEWQPVFTSEEREYTGPLTFFLRAQSEEFRAFSDQAASKLRTSRIEIPVNLDASGLRQHAGRLKDDGEAFRAWESVAVNLAFRQHGAEEHTSRLEKHFNHGDAVLMDIVHHTDGIDEAIDMNFRRDLSKVEIREGGLFGIYDPDIPVDQLIEHASRRVKAYEETEGQSLPDAPASIGKLVEDLVGELNALFDEDLGSIPHASFKRYVNGEELQALLSCHDPSPE